MDHLRLLTQLIAQGVVMAGRKMEMVSLAALAVALAAVALVLLVVLAQPDKVMLAVITTVVLHFLAAAAVALVLLVVLAEALTTA
jgi:hypothetical protein